MSAMKKIHVVFHDGGGGHRNAAVALKTIVEQQQRPWDVELVQFQELTDKLDILRKVTASAFKNSTTCFFKTAGRLAACIFCACCKERSESSIVRWCACWKSFGGKSLATCWFP